MVENACKYQLENVNSTKLPCDAGELSKPMATSESPDTQAPDDARALSAGESRRSLDTTHPHAHSTASQDSKIINASSNVSGEGVSGVNAMNIDADDTRVSGPPPEVGDVDVKSPRDHKLHLGSAQPESRGQTTLQRSPESSACSTPPQLDIPEAKPEAKLVTRVTSIVVNQRRRRYQNARARARWREVRRHLLVTVRDIRRARRRRVVRERAMGIGERDGDGKGTQAQGA
ncbi:hypothetical protein AAMO2058_001316700 [Amorphochlora amoebiformis]